LKTESFFAKTNRSGNLLHIETDGCVVNIHVGLTDNDGNALTRVDVLPDTEDRGGDGEGRVWACEDADGNPGDINVVRVVRRPEGPVPTVPEIKLARIGFLATQSEPIVLLELEIPWHELDKITNGEFIVNTDLGFGPIRGVNPGKDAPVTIRTRDGFDFQAHIIPSKLDVPLAWVVLD
jgi:hypothetical protein